MDLSHLKNGQGDHGTHKLLLNPIPTLQFCCASAQRSREWMLGQREFSLGRHTSSLPMTDWCQWLQGQQASRWPLSTKRLPCLILSP